MTCAYSSPRRDFGLHKMLPVKFYQPAAYVPSQESMNLLTSYKHDFNYIPTCPVGLIKPRDSKFPNGDKTVQYLPTYKGERRIKERTGQVYRPRLQTMCTSPQGKGQTTNCRLNPADSLFLYRWETKNGFTMFNNKKLFQDMLKITIFDIHCWPAHYIGAQS